VTNPNRRGHAGISGRSFEAFSALAARVHSLCPVDAKRGYSDVKLNSFVGEKSRDKFFPIIFQNFKLGIVVENICQPFFPRVH
jgi:hypothetical protein